jgi:hypothetical protein
MTPESYTLEEIPEVDYKPNVRISTTNTTKKKITTDYSLINISHPTPKTLVITEEPEPKKKVQPFAIVALISLLLGYIVIPFLSVIPFSMIALKKIKKYPNKYKGEKLARFLITFSIVILAIILFLVIIGTIFFNNFSFS